MTDNCIVHTSDTLDGMPRIAGRRISVFNVIFQLFYGMSIEAYSDEFEVNKEVIIRALNYCKDKVCIGDNPKNFCWGCTLYKYKKKETFEAFLKRQGYINYLGDDGILENGVVNILGDIEDFREEWEGEDGWSMAVSVLEKYNFKQNS
jgi:uncharacterized protein (DUF433 family)